MDDVRFTPKVEHPKCPYCHEAVRASDDKAPCLACMAWHHRACHDEHGRCASCGAEGDARRPPGPPTQAPVAEPTAPTDETPAPWWRAEPHLPWVQPEAPGAPPWSRPGAATPAATAVDEPRHGEGPALPPPEERHRPLGAAGLLLVLAVLGALSVVLAAVVILLAS